LVNVGVAYEFETKVRPEGYKIVDCKCNDGKKGKRKSRRFHVKWYIKITLNPGIGGKYPLDDFYVTVLGCCCCNLEEENGKEEEPGKPQGGGKEKSPGAGGNKKPKRIPKRE
jgi:hypothetical protein